MLKNIDLLIDEQEERLQYMHKVTVRLRDHLNACNVKMGNGLLNFKSTDKDKIVWRFKGKIKEQLGLSVNRENITSPFDMTHPFFEVLDHAFHQYGKGLREEYHAIDIALKTLESEINNCRSQLRILKNLKRKEEDRVIPSKRAIKKSRELIEKFTRDLPKKYQFESLY